MLWVRATRQAQEKALSRPLTGTRASVRWALPSAWTISAVALSTPAGRFQILGALAEFEREPIRERVRAGPQPRPVVGDAQNSLCSAGTSASVGG